MELRAASFRLSAASHSQKRVEVAAPEGSDVTRTMMSS